MQLDVTHVIKEALEAQYDEFVRTVEEAKEILCSEDGDLENFQVIGRLIQLKPVGEALIVGDLHGDIESCFNILKKSDFLNKMRQKSDAILIFLGDYGDRGEYSKEVYYAILKLKLLFPNQVILMRGNHEGPEDLLASPHDLPLEFQMKFGEKWEEAYTKIRELFRCLYLAVYVEERCLMIHGGLPTQAKTILDLAYAHRNHPKQTFLEEMLWSDPNDIVSEACASPRGAGKLFGKKVTREILERFNVKFLIRGHEPCHEGFKVDHDGMVLTLFSRKGPPYFNAYGAYLQFELAKKFGNAEQLLRYIHKF
ncbi:MAG: metallophosphoesterase family protein [Candidatus Bathyarchaeia archaeon]